MFIPDRLRRWWTQRLLRLKRIPQPLWQQATAQVPVLTQLNSREMHRLRKLASLFLHHKNVIGVGGLELDDTMKVMIAAQAVLLILNLDLKLYDGWSDVVVYPDAFMVTHQTLDEAGVVHEVNRPLEGEAWSRGPVILSWADVYEDNQPGKQVRGSNVVLHEFSHKLDMLNGVANGMPPLHSDIKRDEWTRDFTRAYNKLYERVERNRKTIINPYAAHSPGEFFAVVTEVFFEDAQKLYERFPKVYEELRKYYRQDPRQRRAAYSS